MLHHFGALLVENLKLRYDVMRAAGRRAVCYPVSDTRRNQGHDVDVGKSKFGNDSYLAGSEHTL